MSAVEISVAFYSGYGHTTQLAEAVAAGVRTVTGTTVECLNVSRLDDAGWNRLDASAAIIFGSPTYMGTAAGPFHAFAQETSGRWMRRAWQDKIAAGFTNSGSMSGDKLHTLQYMALLAAQHGMQWVSLGLAPGWNTTAASELDDNRLGFYLGAAAQSWNDQGTVHEADLRTATHLGGRVARSALTMRHGTMDLSGQLNRRTV